MPITKEAVEKQAAEIQGLLASELKDLPLEGQVLELLERGYYGAAISKVLRISGTTIAQIRKSQAVEPPAVAPQLPPKGDEDRQLGDKAYEARLRQARLDAKKPVVTREIEDSAWFHNLCTYIGKNLTLRAWGSCALDERAGEDWMKAGAEIMAYYDGLRGFEDDAGILVDVKRHLSLYELGYDMLQRRYKYLMNLYSVVCGVLNDAQRNQITTVLILQGLLSPDMRGEVQPLPPSPIIGGGETS